MATLTCELIQADKPTANNRVYSTKVLERMVEQINEEARHGKMFGELGFNTETKVSISDVSHMVEPTARLENGKLVVDVTPLNTPAGRLLQQSLDAQETLTLFPIGMGYTDEDGIIADNFRIIKLNVLGRDWCDIWSGRPNGKAADC